MSRKKCNRAPDIRQNRIIALAGVVTVRVVQHPASCLSGSAREAFYLCTFAVTGNAEISVVNAGKIHGGSVFAHRYDLKSGARQRLDDTFRY